MSEIYKTLFVTACLSLSFSFSLSAQNLLINPDFETGMAAPWRAGNAPEDPDAVIIEDAQSGMYAVQGNAVQYVDLVAGVNYTYTAYAKCVGECGNNVWIGIKDVVDTSTPAANFNFNQFSDYELCTVEYTAVSTGSHRFWMWGQNDVDYIGDNFVLLAEGTSDVYNLSGNHTLEITNQIDAVTLKIDADFEEVAIKIFDISGREIQSLTTSDTRNVFNKDTFPISGIYVFHVKIGKHVIAKQVAIVK